MRRNYDHFDGRHIIYDRELFPCSPRELFDPQHLKAKGLLTTFSDAGRGTVWMFRYRDTKYALRHYRRGGMMTGILDDLYPWQPLSRARPTNEACMLEMLCKRRMPVPRPAAWQVCYQGPFYRADLITLQISNALPLNRFLRQNALDDYDWYELGIMIRSFHNRQIWHADLNLSNILISPGPEFTLIDFDRAKLRRGQYWKRKNLDRLYRSCCKEQCYYPDLHFEDANFSSLWRGYNE